MLTTIDKWQAAARRKVQHRRMAFANLGPHSAVSLAPVRIADEILQDDHRFGSLRETPMPWTSMWSRSERRGGLEAEDEMAEV